MSEILLDQFGGVATLTLNRPARTNALTEELIAQLHEALDGLDAPRAVVLRGAGAHFSTGGDVARFAREVAAGNGTAYARRIVGGLNTAILRLAALPCPVLALVQGALTGGSLGLVLAADLVVMDRRAFIQPYYVQVGFAPDGGWTAMLPARIGTARARAIQLLNQRISAEEAVTLGIAQAVEDDPEARLTEWLERLARHDPAAMAATKSLLPAAPDLKAGLEAELAGFLDRIETPEVRAGMARFLARSKGA